MSNDDDLGEELNVGEWSKRVAYSERGGFAYRPGQVFVQGARGDEAASLLGTRPSQASALVREPSGTYERIAGVDDTIDGIEFLRAEGLPAHPNHVMFSHCQCCCGPHPANLFSANPFSSNPFSSNPFSNPFSSNPFSSNPFSSNPFSSNPSADSWANYVQPNPHPLRATAGFEPATREFQRSGRRPHSARQAVGPYLPPPPTIDGGQLRPPVVVIDTGIATGTLRPAALEGPDIILNTAVAGVCRRPASETPDRDGDYLIDPIAGHGTFIAGIIRMIAPGCELHVQGPVSGYGDIDEHDVGLVLDALAPQPPGLLNLSFGGYSVSDMPRLAESVRGLQRSGWVVVASAGNDATCQPAYPAALPDVVAVGALGQFGPAPFTNYGPWVRACAPGVDVVSTFFKQWQSTIDAAERYEEWVRWSGTSFAAPAVTGALARAMREGLDAQQAVDRLIDDPGLFRIHGLGAVVNQTPWWRKRSGQ